MIAATNADLQARIKDERFRRDLYFRLAHVTIDVPPLRERKADIPQLAAHFLSMFTIHENPEREEARKFPSPQLSDATLAALMDYDFPGNVRELKNIVERALIECDGEAILPEHLHFIESPTASTPTVSPDNTEALLIKGALMEANGDVNAAAQRLGISTAEVQPFREALAAFFSPQSTSAPLRPTTDEDQIYAYVQQHGSISNAECRELLDVDIHRANYLLNKMCANDHLRRVGRQRAARYEPR
ncbi:sigma-54-dependent Fis family transcriptional regulator [Candidatus Poribacteria bacterium]|nr:sigma-54-dependent Fis family transcriptional regulator [Candidatus Poribacteria bacterium]